MANKEIEGLRQMIQSYGWQAVVLPTLQRTIVSDMDSLAAVKRPAEHSDDYLRGRISAIRDILINLPKRVDEYDLEQRKLEEAKKQAEAPASGSPYEKE